MATRQARPRQHPVQVSAVWVNRAVSVRRVRKETDPGDPVINTGRVRHSDLRDDATAFTCTTRIRVRIPVLDDELWDATLWLVAEAVAGRVLTEEEADSFAANSALYVMWPFARAYFDQLAMLSGLIVPPLPLIVRAARSTTVARAATTR